jgi:hypothetical protein
MSIFKQITEKKATEKKILRVQKSRIVFFDRVTSLYFSGQRDKRNYTGQSEKFRDGTFGIGTKKVCPAWLYEKEKNRKFS